MTYHDRSQYELTGKELDDFLDFRHKKASAHRLAILGARNAERAENRERARLARKAEALRKKAQALLDEASEAERLSYRPFYDWPQPMKDKIREIEEQGYWEARKAIGLG